MFAIFRHLWKGGTMLIINNTPYTGLTCELWTYDSTKADGLGSKVQVLFKNKLLYFPIYKASISTNTNVTNQYNNAFSGKVENPLLLDWVSFRSDSATSAAALFENKTMYFPAVETYPLPATYVDYDDYILKWYADSNPNTYLTARERNTYLVEDGVLVDSAGPESGIDHLFELWLQQARAYVHVPVVTYNETTKEITVKTYLELYRYQNSVFATMPANSNTPNKNAILNRFLNGLPDYTQDPYSPGGPSDADGGAGDFDNTGDDVDFPALPTLSAVDTGFITIYNPTVTQLKNLCNYMWSNGFDLDTLKKLFADPMDAVLGLSIVPVSVPASGAATVSVGNISTGLTMDKATTQYVEVDCGTLNVNEYWGAYLDYEPFTKAEIYLPYIGTHAIAVDDIMKKAVSVKYHVDILSGACVAYVKCGGSVLYSFIGQCASSIPISGNDWTNVINGVLSIAGSIGSMVATGGASAPSALPGLASTAVNSLKPTVEKSGSLSGTAGIMGIQKPYLILTRPRQAVPAGQNDFVGYPSFITAELSTLSGYTEIEKIHLENIPATAAELEEIETILLSGVIF